MPGIPTTVINAVLKFADREHKPTGVAFRNRKNELFNFTNDEIDDILMPRTVDVAPYPDIENKLPGPMTVTPVTADPEPAQPDRDEQAIQAANNAGLDINIIADPGMPMQHHYNAIPVLHDAVVSDDDTNSASETDATASDDESHAPYDSDHSSTDSSEDDDDDDADDDNTHPAPQPTSSGLYQTTSKIITSTPRLLSNPHCIQSTTTR